MEEIKKGGHGGRREGSGRKKTCVKTYCVYAPQEIVDILEQVEGSKSEFICQCILMAIEKGR